ncbi:preprotein translocase subunit YajC [uncultured Ilumatobacter sp.]|jgi:preprotein translocase subunit YajC|uniref:preprotein translocase subunit YajC n=1 Tax=Ilumatobacter sp. TaxID=1967498 RepID=UPI0030B3C9D6|tara:strand:- start:3124 stop:3531 length:408 start_codon:yes stop_codon:yes gene_type:complete
MPSTLATTIFANADSGGSSILSFLFLPLILVAMYFLMIRPQRKRMRDQQDLQKSVEVGQDVVTTSGVFGTITGEDGPNRFWLEIDDDVQIRIARAAIQSVTDLEADDAVAEEAVAEEVVDADDNGSADAPASTED